MRSRRTAWLVPLVFLAGSAGGPVVAQNAGQGGDLPAAPSLATPSPREPAGPAANNTPVTVPSPVLTIDPDRLFSGSKFGLRIQKELEDAARALASENRRIEAELSAEELELTQKRGTMAPEAFRKVADDFDAKVKRIRAEQDAKNTAITNRREAERQKFLQLVLPILGELMREDGAVALLNQQSIFLSFRGIDITDQAIARIDAKIGDGAALDGGSGSGNGNDRAPPPDGSGPAPDAGGAGSPETLPAPDAGTSGH